MIAVGGWVVGGVSPWGRVCGLGWKYHCDLCFRGLDQWRSIEEEVV